MSTNEFKLSNPNKLILKNLSFHNDEIGTLTKSFLQFEHLSEKHLEQLKKNIRRREKLENSLRIARDIQLNLLPKIPGTLTHSNVDLYALLESAEKIGGDWYDFFFLDDQSLFFTLGDVSDKSISAAIFMATVKTHISSIVEFERNPAEVIRLLNKKLLLNNDRHMFVTLFLGILNITTGDLDYVNAGHCTPILLQKNQTPIFLEESYQTIVGAIKDANYYSKKITLNQHDILFLYSDGVIEATNKTRQVFSDKRLLDCLAKAQIRKVRPLIRSVYAEVKQFSKRPDPSDDISMLAVSLTQKIELTHQKIWLTLPASMAYLNKFILFIHQNLGKNLILTERKNEITLTLEELLVNIIKNAYLDENFGLISISCESLTPKKIILQLEDYGRAFNPVRYIQEQAFPRPIKKRGCGLQLVHHFCDNIKYKRVEGKNILTLEF